MKIRAEFLLTTLAAIGLAGVGNAGTVVVNSNIASSTTWTANNTYDLQAQIYVLPGATLTMEPGTVIASTPTGNGSGSLAITKGAKIIACGTKDNPIIFTSLNDVATWTPDPAHPTGGDPTTGVWRQAANEWGNVTIMGNGLVSENATPGNSPTCNAANVGQMEGLAADANGLYGGGNDDDDSGKMEYVSIRYGGRVVNFNNELNGLSLGGVGRETDINHIEIMNNVDDGIEIWGGTVNLKHVSIWNVGDDSFDLDQGWRGMAQFGLIVQGYSLDAGQGSGVGDNALETDGAEDADWQPVSTTTIYNFTVIGQPQAGDHGTAWRDNARVQYRNCIFMNLGEQLVKFDNVDGDGANGYGFNGTLSWANTWLTDYNAVPPHANDCGAGTYVTQTSGKLAEIKDSVFYSNLHASAYTEATARGVLDPGNNNILEPASSPITSIVRGPVVVKGGLNLEPVTFLDPRPANDALNSVAFAPANGFFCQAKYRGAFAKGQDWLNGWTASQAYGFSPAKTGWCDAGFALAGILGSPNLQGSGPLTPGTPFTISLDHAKPSSLVFLIIGFSELGAPFKGGVVYPAFNIFLKLPTNALGELNVAATWPALPPGFPLYFQYLIADAAAVQGFAFSNGLQAVAQ